MIELFGLPGAGKTTISSEAVSLEGVLGRSCISQRWRTLTLLGRTEMVLRTLLDIRWLSCIARLIVRTPIRRRESYLRLARLAFGKAWLASQHGYFVLDQGTLQNLWSIFYIEGVVDPPHPELVRLLRSFYAGRCCMIVMLDVDPELAAQRVHDRDMGSSRLDHLPQGAVLDRLQNIALLPSAIIEAASEAGLTIRRLDGAQPPASLQDELKAIVERDRDRAANR